MKRNIINFKSLILVMLLAGCVPSIHPLYTEDDIVFLPVLLGTWEEEDEGTWTFTKKGDNSYFLQMVEDDESANFIVHLVSLDDHLFMDFFPGDNDHIEMCAFLSVHYFPVHTFAKVIIDKEKIEIHCLDPGFIEDLLEQNKIRISHEKSDDNIILTASTEELQKFVRKYADDQKAYVSPTVLKKI